MTEVAGSADGVAEIKSAQAAGPYRSGVLRLRSMRPGQMRSPSAVYFDGIRTAAGPGARTGREARVGGALVVVPRALWPVGGTQAADRRRSPDHGPGGSARVVRSRGTERDQPAHAGRLPPHPGRGARRRGDRSRSAGEGGTDRRGLAGLLLGVLTIVKILDMGFFAAFDRPFNPVTDRGYFGPALAVARDSIGETKANVLGVVAALLAVAIVVLMPLSVLRLTRLASRHRTGSIRTGHGTRSRLDALCAARRAVRAGCTHRLHQRVRPRL